MRKSLLDIEETDRYLLQQLNAQAQALFEARLILEPGLRANLRFHRKVHSLIRWFARLRKKEELQRVHERLMQDKKFQQEINAIFI